MLVLGYCTKSVQRSWGKYVTRWSRGLRFCEEGDFAADELFWAAVNEGFFRFDLERFGDF